MKDKLLGQKDKKKFFIRKCLQIYSDALCQAAQCFELRAKILTNRALLHMWLKNYGKGIQDCLEAIKLDPKFIRAYARCCECLLNLGMYEKCLKMADKGLSIEFQKEMKEIRDDAVKRLTEENAKKAERQTKKKEEDTKLLDMCKERGIVLGNLSDYPLPTVYNRKLLIEDDELVFPIVFIYPEFGQFDYIERMDGQVTLWDAFNEIFDSGLPWDEHKFYLDKKNIIFAVKVNEV